MAANYASIWILTLICAQRYQSICHPSNVWKKRLNFLRQSKLLTFCSVVLALGKIFFFIRIHSHKKIFYKIKNINKSQIKSKKFCLQISK